MIHETLSHPEGAARLACRQHKLDGAHPLPDLFRPTIRVPLRTPRNEGQKKILSVDR